MNRVSLSSIIDVISGGTPKTKVSEYWNGDIGWLSVTDFNNDLRFVYDTEKKITEKGVKESNTKFLNKGDIIISARGTVGVLAQVGKPMCFNQSCFGIRGKENIANTDFLYYSLKNYVKNIIKRSQGSVFNTINLKSFDLMEIEIPKSISTQKSIAKVLSDLDSKIAINNKINAALEAMVKTLYDYWFVQFDFPDKNGNPYKSSEGKMIFNEDLKREIPEGWESGTFETFSTIIGGSTPSKSITENFTKEVNMSWITPKDLSLNKGKKFITRGEWDVTNFGIKSASLKIMPKGTVLLSSRAPIGYLAISRKEVTTNQGFKSFVPKENYSSEFIYYSVKNQIPKIEAYSSGSTFKEVSLSVLKTIKISIPNKNILEKYYKISKPIFKEQNLLELENQKLSELRDWLLPMLMNGQVRVGEK
ncbi:restriction endonuclease subunit S [Tenacibaculum finnmarkense]|uniref:restriction endonuclease subunit S n=1 Tax=Tenacibaculum finnmarkense TaxID=2781243 RepID=UPI001EFC0FA0|nr:restriction endonuclease subunit S [Tenacibaculum finnmarkense]MCG8795911.1 restriction endonuclease subunit S [Tenacibaculum finnmarkense]MCG8798098.1 restriction endonuclease subunit S [Tenacibaculum finnmarkense]